MSSSEIMRIIGVDSANVTECNVHNKTSTGKQQMFNKWWIFIYPLITFNMEVCYINEILLDTKQQCFSI